MINMFRTVLLNMDPATANLAPTAPGYMVTDPGYTFKAWNNVNKEIYSALFVGAVTDAEKVARATTIHKLVEGSMLYAIITNYDDRVTGFNSITEDDPDVLPNIIAKLDDTIIDPTIPLFNSSSDSRIFGDHAFHRDEPAEIIAGFAGAIVNDVILTRRLT